MAHLDERALADLGVSRSDLREAAGEAFQRDPMALLSGHAGNRTAERAED